MKAGRFAAALAVPLLAATATAPAGAQEAPPAPALDAFVAAYNAGDPAALAEIVDARFGPDVVAQYGGPEGTVGRFLHLRDAYGPVAAWRLDTEMRPPVLWTRAAEVEGWIGFQPRVDPAAERWSGLTIWRIRPPGAPALPPVPPGAAADSLHAFLERNAAAGRFSGTVLVARGDSVHFYRSYGVADRETGELVTPAHRSNIGSVGKMFTAVAALRLVDEGVISLDDPLSKHVSEYPRAIGDAVTVRDLLTHASGIELDDVPGFGEALRTAATPEEILEVHLPFVDEVAAQYERTGEYDYTNEGFSLLGLIVERAGGLAWDEALERHVFGPAGMTSTTFSAPADAPVAVGYTAIAADGGFDPGPARPAWPVIKPRAHPAGQHWSTAEDLWRFWRALGHGGLLRPETARDMVAPQIDAGGLAHFDLTTAYGHGIQIETREGRTHVGHGGVVPGYSAAVRHFPESDWTIVITSNAEDTAAHVVAERAEAILMGRGEGSTEFVGPD